MTMDNENARSAAHASAAGVRLPKDWPGTDYTDIEHIEAVDPNDNISRLARDRYNRRKSERDQGLELGLSEPVPKKVAHVPKDTEPYSWVAFCGIVSGATVAALGAAALLGWSINAALKWAGWM